MTNPPTPAGSEGETPDLVAFARDIMEHWPEGGVDGCDLQEIAAKHGLLRKETRTTFCGTGEECDDCPCREYMDEKEAARGSSCYRRVPLALPAHPIAPAQGAVPPVRDFTALKGPMIGEFKHYVDDGSDEDGNERGHEELITWTNIKAVIRMADKLQPNVSAAP